MRPIIGYKKRFISRHYRQAYGLLGELKTNDVNVLEIKVVAGFINYKVCIFKKVFGWKVIRVKFTQ